MLAINSTFFCWAIVNASANCQKCDDKLFDELVLLGPFSSDPIILCAFSLELGENVTAQSPLLTTKQLLART